MSKKGRKQSEPEKANRSSESDSVPVEGDTSKEVEIVDPATRSMAETDSGEKKKGVWKGDPSNRWVPKAGMVVKPSELLKAFRKVYRGNLSVNDMNNPSIQTIQQLKLEDNAKFLTEFRTLTKEHQERVVRKQEQVAKTAEAAATVSRDKSTDDLLIVIDELLAECVSASKA